MGKKPRYKGQILNIWLIVLSGLMTVIAAAIMLLTRFHFLTIAFTALLAVCFVMQIIFYRTEKQKRGLEKSTKPAESDDEVKE